MLSTSSSLRGVTVTSKLPFPIWLAACAISKLFLSIWPMDFARLPTTPRGIFFKSIPVAPFEIFLAATLSSLNNLVISLMVKATKTITNRMEIRRKIIVVFFIFFSCSYVCSIFLFTDSNRSRCCFLNVFIPSVQIFHHWSAV